MSGIWTGVYTDIPVLHRSYNTFVYKSNYRPGRAVRLGRIISAIYNFRIINTISVQMYHTTNVTNPRVRKLFAVGN